MPAVDPPPVPMAFCWSTACTPHLLYAGAAGAWSLAAMKRTRDEEEREDDAVASSAEGSGGTGAPKPRAPDVAARLALGALPCSEMYEKSFMHRDHVTHIVCTSSDFIVTGSRDGQVKFWKKMQMGIEFVKHFRAHLAPVSCMAATSDGSLLATTAADKAFKARTHGRDLPP